MLIFFCLTGPMIIFLVLSVDKLCKQFGFRSGLTKCQAWSDSKLFDTLIVPMKKTFQTVDFEKFQHITKIIKNSTACKEFQYQDLVWFPMVSIM